MPLEHRQAGAGPTRPGASATASASPAFWQGWQGPGVFVSRLLWSAAAWWILTEGAVDSWIIGVPAVTAAAVLSTLMLPPLRWSWGGAFGFVGFFLVDSLRGGIDVALRAMHWRLPLDPGIVEYPMRLPLPMARVSMSNTASLLPGTLVADMDEVDFHVHALDAGREIRESLEKAERQVARLFSLPLDTAVGGDPGGERP